MRKDNRKPDELRKIKITRHFTEAPAGSVLVEFGKTRVLCTAMIEDGENNALSFAGAGELP